MRPNCAALLLLVAATLPGARRLHAQADADRAGVTRAAMDYIEGFYEGDTAKLVRSISPQVSKYGYYQPKGRTEYVGEPMSWKEILDYARKVKASGKPTPATAPKGVELLQVLDQTAVAKVTAWWGTDFLLLARIDGRWMTTHVLWQSTPISPPR